MEHPFIPSLDDKTIEELQSTITDLMSKLTFAYRTGNSQLIHQLTMALESYKTAHTKKLNEQMDKLLEKQKLPIRVERKQ